MNNESTSQFIYFKLLTLFIFESSEQIVSFFCLNNWHFVKFLNCFGKNFSGYVSFEFHSWGQNVALDGEGIHEELELFGSLERVQFVGFAERDDISINLVSETLVFKG